MNAFCEQPVHALKKDIMQQLPSEIQVIWSAPELIIWSRLIGVRPNNYSLAFSITVRLHFACYSVCCPFSSYSVSFLGYTTLFCMTGKWNWKQEKRSLENKADMTLYKKCALHSFAYWTIKLPTNYFYKSATYWSLWKANRNSGHSEFAALYINLFKFFKTSVLYLSDLGCNWLNCKVIFPLTL